MISRLRFALGVALLLAVPGAWAQHCRSHHHLPESQRLAMAFVPGEGGRLLPEVRIGCRPEVHRRHARHCGAGCG